MADYGNADDDDVVLNTIGLLVMVWWAEKDIANRKIHIFLMAGGMNVYGFDKLNNRKRRAWNINRSKLKIMENSRKYFSVKNFYLLFGSLCWFRIVSGLNKQEDYGRKL